MNNAGYSPGPFILRHYVGYSQTGGWEFRTREMAEACAAQMVSTHPPGHSFIVYDDDGDPIHEVKS